VVEIVYKAAIRQNTGEVCRAFLPSPTADTFQEWVDVPITLETAQSTSNVGIPKLGTWNVSVHKPAPPPPPRTFEQPAGSFFIGAPAPAPAPGSASGLFGAPQAASAAYTGILAAPPPAPRPVMTVATTTVSSQGGVNATFKVPGLISIPSDGVSHNVTIATLTPEAKLEWVSVPSISPRVHLTVRSSPIPGRHVYSSYIQTTIKNTSEYTLLSGSSNVYVDGSFVAKSSISLVSPLESFNCSLGLDPSIRVTYHPRVKKSATSGLFSKTNTTSYTQRIVVHNTKSVTVKNLKITDRIPVSQDSQVTVNLLSPALPQPAAPSSSLGPSVASKAATALTKVRVAEGVIAQWHCDEIDDDATGAELPGTDGKIDWLSTLEAQKKVELVLNWEVSVASGVTLTGL